METKNSKLYHITCQSSDKLGYIEWHHQICHWILIKQIYKLINRWYFYYMFTQAIGVVVEQESEVGRVTDEIILLCY